MRNTRLSNPWLKAQLSQRGGAKSRSPRVQHFGPDDRSLLLILWDLQFREVGSDVTKGVISEPIRQDRVSQRTFPYFGALLDAGSLRKDFKGSSDVHSEDR